MLQKHTDFFPTGGGIGGWIFGNVDRSSYICIVSNAIKEKTTKTIAKTFFYLTENTGFWKIDLFFLYLQKQTITITKKSSNMKKFKIEFCSLECTGIKYFTEIKFGTLRSAKKVLNALEKEGYEAYLYRRKKGADTDHSWDWEQIENAA